MRCIKFMVLVLAMAMLSLPVLATPPVTTGLVLDFEANAIHGLSNGDKVASWPDISGHNNNAVQANTDRQPVFETNAINGLPAIRFDGADDFLKYNEQWDRTVFWVIMEDAGTSPNWRTLLGHHYWADYHRGANNTIFSSDWASPKVYNGVTRLNGAVVNPTTTVVPNTFSIISNVATNSCIADQIGQDRGYTGRNWKGAYAELLIYSGALTDAQQRQVGAYLQGKYGLAAEYAASTPSPANDATGVALGTNLTWDALDTIPNAVCTVYFGTDSNMPGTNKKIVDGIFAESADLASTYGTLALDTDYYWRVDVTNTDPNGDGSAPPLTYKGVEWHFHTALPKPVIVEGTPADTLVDAGDDAVFTVDATNPYTGDTTNLAYQWYKYVDGTNDIALTDGSDYSGATTATLTVSSAQVADEGNYYCVVTLTTNSQTSTSRQAYLATKRMVSYWPFDGNLTDTVSGQDGTFVDTGATGLFDTGIIGSGAVKFLPKVDPNSSVVTVPTAALKTKSWTISWWDNGDPDHVGGSWETILGNGAGPDGWEIFEFDRNPSYRYAFGFNIGGGYAWSPDDSSYPRGQWHLNTVTYDPATKDAIWYIDGRAYHTFAGVNFSAFDTEFYVGDVRGRSQPFAGSVDDLRLYDYPLTPKQVANLYITVMGGSICVQRPAMDFNNDCVVDVNDLAELVDNWLACGWYPSSVCP